jgi:hypothetical protein
MGGDLMWPFDIVTDTTANIQHIITISILGGALIILGLLFGLGHIPLPGKIYGRLVGLALCFVAGYLMLTGAIL